MAIPFDDWIENGPRGRRGSGMGSTGDSRPIEYARVLDLVSEGPIEGLVDGLKSVFLDDTPVQNGDGSLNFDGVILQAVKGTGTQGVISGFPEVETEVSVNTQVTVSGGAVTRTITTTGLSAVRVKIGIPALKSINPTNGQEAGAQAQVKVEIQSASYNAGAWTQVDLDQNGLFRGKFGTRLTKSFRIPLPAAGPWQVRVTRLTADAPDSYTVNATWWDSYTELKDARLNYPFSALFALEVDAQQFQSIPKRSYEIKGRVIKVPTNYDPATRVYATTGPGTTAGAWDGTFKDAWTDNPAWVFYDLATHTRYGAGSYLDVSLVDKWVLYEIAQYCDELVDDGKSGTEPRFTCNLYLQTQEDAIRTLTNLLGAFRAMAYSRGGAIVAVQDSPSDPVAIFTNSAVQDGQFNYAGSSRRSRHTVAIVGWNDPADSYKLVPEVVEDTAGVARYGYQPVEVTALGCTSRGQARRFGLWILNSEMTETESVSFVTALEGANVSPGELIQVQDHHRAGNVRWGGRIVSATTTSVTLDRPVTLESGKSYQIRAMLPDGTMETKAISTGAGTHTSLTVSAFSQAPGAEAQWVVQDASLTPKLYRIVSIEAGDWLEHTITAIEHNPDKYAAVETGLTLGPDGSGGTTSISPVTDLVLESYVELRFGARIMHLTASWTPQPGAIGYRAVCSRYFGPWQDMDVSAASADLAGAEAGDWRVRVVAVYLRGTSTFVEEELTISEAASLPDGIAAEDLGNVPSTAFQTSDYAEDAYGNPTAGAWLGVGESQPLKVGPLGIQIGALKLKEDTFYQQKLINTGFTAGLDPGWTLATGALTTQTPPTVSVSSGGSGSATMRQNVMVGTIPEGKSPTIKLKHKATKGTDPSDIVQVTVTLTNLDGGSSPSSQSVSPPGDNTQRESTLTFSDLTVKGAYRVQIALTAIGGTSAASVEIDDVRFYA